MRRQAARAHGVRLRHRRHDGKARRARAVPSTTYRHREAEDELVEIVDFLKNPHATELGAGPRGVLLYGPPGTGRRCWPRVAGRPTALFAARREHAAGSSGLTDAREDTTLSAIGDDADNTPPQLPRAGSSRPRTPTQSSTPRTTLHPRHPDRPLKAHSAKQPPPQTSHTPPPHAKPPTPTRNTHNPTPPTPAPHHPPHHKHHHPTTHHTHPHPNQPTPQQPPTKTKQPPTNKPPHHHRTRCRRVGRARSGSRRNRRAGSAGRPGR